MELYFFTLDLSPRGDYGFVEVATNNLELAALRVRDIFGDRAGDIYTVEQWYEDGVSREEFYGLAREGYIVVNENKSLRPAPRHEATPNLSI